MRSVIVALLFAGIGAAQPEVAKDLNDRALEASDKRELDEAKKLFAAALEKWRALGPGYDAHIAITLTNLAQIYGSEGRRAECVAMLEEAIALFRRSIGIKDVRSLTAVNLAGGIYMMLGNHPRAAALFEEALPIERELFPNDAQLARSLGGLASLRMREGNVKDAMPLAAEALAVTLKAEGENTLDAALAYANLAEGHRVSGEPARALPLFKKSQAIYERLLGPDHPRVASILTQESIMMLADGKVGMAEDALEKALAIIDRSCPRCAYERAAAQNDLALVRIRQGRYAEADRLLSEVLDLQEKADAMPASEIATTLQSLSVVRQKEKRFEDADRLKRRAARLLQSYR